VPVAPLHVSNLLTARLAHGRTRFPPSLRRGVTELANQYETSARLRGQNAAASAVFAIQESFFSALIPVKLMIALVQASPFLPQATAAFRGVAPALFSQVGPLACHSSKANARLRA
jgi:hypothetical protein